MNVEAIDPNVTYEHWPVAKERTRQCATCHAVLSSYNKGKRCAPCRQGEEDRRTMALADAEPVAPAVLELRQHRNNLQQLRRAKYKRRAQECADMRAEATVDGVNYLNVTQTAWCLDKTVGEVVAMWKRGELASASAGRGSKAVFAMSELERWRREK